MLKRNQEETKIEVVKQPEQKSQEALLGKGGLKKGHVMWQYNNSTFELTVAEIDSVPAEYKPTVKTNNIAYFGKHRQKTVGKVITKKDCFYFGALNRKNAIRILNEHFKIFEVK